MSVVKSIKLVLLGEAAVGKSSLVLRFVSNEFQENKEPTIGAAFLTQRCSVNQTTVKFEIWDTAGQERFASLAPMYYRNAQAALVVYDLTKPGSFIKARHWIKELHEQANAGDMVIFLVGNKLDLVEEDEEQRKVSTEDGEALAKEEGCFFMETSAKNSINVKDVFMKIAEEFLKKVPVVNPASTNANQNNENGNNRVDLNVRNNGAQINDCAC